MSFRLPNRIPSKRASSFHFKKAVTPLQNFCEDTEQLLSRNQTSTPNTTKTNRVASFVEMNSSPKRGSKNTFNSHIFDTPKARIMENRNLSIVDSRLIYMSDIHEKFSPIPKPQALKFAEELKKNEEKHLTRILELTKENELLKIQIEKWKNRKEQVNRNKTLKEIKHLSETFRTLTENFIIKVREDIDTLCTIISANFSVNVSEIPQVLERFNSHLRTLAPLFGQDLLQKHFFVTHDFDLSQNTGRFRSLSDTQHSFKSPNSPSFILKEVIALSDFRANHHGELSFNAGDRIQLIKTDDPQWWLGKLADKIGRVPAQLVMLD